VSHPGARSGLEQGSKISVGVTVEQLRRRVPGGIATYINGLLAGVAKVHDGSVKVAPVGERLPARVLTRCWSAGFPFWGPLGLDVLHATTLAFPQPLSRATRVVVAVHDLAWRELPGSFTARGVRWHERALRRVLANASAYVVPSGASAAALVAAGADPVTVKVIEYGADHLPPADTSAAHGLLEARGVHGPFLLTVGTREPRKNLDRLVAAHARACARWDKPVPLVVVGPEGWGHDSLKQGASASKDAKDAKSKDIGHASRRGDEASRRGDEASQQVVVAGRVDPALLAGLYRLALALVYVPLAEGYGLPVLEALLEGTPVVSSPVPTSGEGTLVVDPLDVDAIADGLDRIVNDDELRAELADAGEARCKTRTWEATARAHLELWRSLS